MATVVVLLLLASALPFRALAELNATSAELLWAPCDAAAGEHPAEYLLLRKELTLAQASTARRICDWWIGGGLVVDYWWIGGGVGWWRWWWCCWVGFVVALGERSFN